MPPFPVSTVLNSLVDRDTISKAAQALEPQVVCAWPVSGQYGFGTRVLYYILVATCVLARRTEWLRNACLAAALLLPAVAAIHAVVLAAVHVDTAVDMDIYGAFQICSIGILAAPITVYNSKTYFNDPGRNIIFLWTGLLLTGMLSLTVEFYRAETHGCSVDNANNTIPFDAYKFPYEMADCNLQCSPDPGGPYSPIRRGANNEIFVIPAPQRLTFSAVTLLAAGSSIPPVLTLLFTWEKIREINGRRLFGREEAEDVPIEGTNGATPKMIGLVNMTIQNFLSTIQIPIFGGIIIVLLTLGELNFWSPQVDFQTEPLSSVGQWANVVATALVVFGSLFYVQKESGGASVKDKDASDADHSECRGSCEPRHSTQTNDDDNSVESRSPRAPSPSPAGDGPNNIIICGHTVAEAGSGLSLRSHSADHDGSIELARFGSSEQHYTTLEPISNKHRHTVANILTRVSKYISEPAESHYDDTSFRRVGQRNYPDIPGEAERNARLQQIRDQYRNSRDHEEASSTPAISRKASFSSVLTDGEGASSRRGVSPSRPNPAPSRSNTTPTGAKGNMSPELSRIITAPTSTGRPRRDTLEVPDFSSHPIRPNPAHLRSGSTSSSVFVPDSQGSPRIVISQEPEEASPTSPISNTPPDMNATRAGPP
ncbi:hypothetical protein GGS20DRAFT_429543 [Poronia punctata]|nr:hypothetical protein GGS20DRAFT_429543 [Poronia punctata]